MTQRTEDAAPSRRWDLWGAAAGAALGLVDLLTFRSLGVEMTWAGQDVSTLVVGVFALTFAALGFALGRLHHARQRERRDADLIARQLRALASSQQQAAQAEKMAAIGRLAAGVAHEVRNPLGVIRASASLLQEDFDPHGDPWRASQFIVEEIDRLDAMITALLKFARPERLDLQRVNLADPLDRALALARPQAQARGIALTGSLTALPALSADPDLLCQLVYGLTLNAVEILDPGGAIEVRALAADDALEVEVADSGPGVPPEDAEAIFEPFFTTRPGGTGLGLAIAAQIAHAHGGELRALQGRGLGPGGAGACLNLRLPLDSGSPATHGYSS